MGGEVGGKVGELGRLKATLGKQQAIADKSESREGRDCVQPWSIRRLMRAVSNAKQRESREQAEPITLECK